MIRRLKSEVLPDLPPKVRTVIPLEIDNRKEYNKAQSNLITWIDENEGAKKAEKASQAEHLVRFEKLKQLVVKGKMSAMKEWILNYLEQNEKILIFAEHRNDPFNVVKWMQNIFNKAGIKNKICIGGMSSDKKEEAIQSFNNDPTCRALIGTKSMKEGHSITSTSDAVFIELWWTPGEHDQAESRVWGIKRGDGKAQVNAYYLLGANTIDEEIAGLLDDKRRVLDAILDGKEVEESSLFSELIAKMKGE